MKERGRVPRVARAGSTFESDFLARATLVLFASSAVLYLLPVVSAETRARLSWVYVPLAFLVLVLLALQKDLGTFYHSGEPQFWNDLTLAFGCSVPGLGQPPVPAGSGLSFAEARPKTFSGASTTWRWSTPSSGGLTAAPTGGRWGSSGRSPCRGDGVRPRAPRRTSAAIPRCQPRGLWFDLPSIYLFLRLDLYLTVSLRLPVAGRPHRTLRAIYALLALTTGAILIADLLEALRKITLAWEWGAVWDPLWNLPFLTLVLAARIRHHRFPDRELKGSSLGPMEGALSGPGPRTLVAALAFPLFHFAGYLFGILDPASRSERDTLVLWWLLLLGSIALVQHRLLDRKVREIWR